MNALVIETAFLGDAILSVALAEALRQHEPDAKITYLVRPESKLLLEYAPAVDHVISYDKYGDESGVQAITSKAEELNKLKFDVVFSLHESQRTRMLLEKLTAPMKIGYGDFTALTDKVEPIPNIQRTARVVSLLKVLYPNVDLATLPKLDVSSVTVPDELRNAVSPIVTIAPGSVWKTKRWPAEYFASVANDLSAEGSTVVFIGSPQDLQAMDKARPFLTRPHLDLVGKTTIAEAAAVISRSKFLVANDSAPVHIATALGTPTVVMFGPTVRQFGFAPPESLGVVVEKSGLWCRPCTSHGSNECPTHTHECMTAIGPEQVLAATQKFAEFKAR